MKEHDDNLKTSSVSTYTHNNGSSRNLRKSNFYITVLNSKKPYAFIEYKNDLGKEVNLYYKPSTQYHIEDKQNGTSRVIELHFPLYYVSKLAVFNEIVKTEFTSEYSYHHGYYDHLERELCGFGVNQKDAEDIAQFIKDRVKATNNIIVADLHQPRSLQKNGFIRALFLMQKEFLIILG